MNKWPGKIYKQKFNFGNLHGYIWLDRWRENIWFETTGRLYVPIEVSKLIKALPFEEGLRLNFKLIYDEPIDMSALIYWDNPFLKLIPKDNIYSKPVIIPINYIPKSCR